jgi:hypothetical protein
MTLSVLTISEPPGASAIGLHTTTLSQIAFRNVVLENCNASGVIQRDNRCL